MTVEAKKIKILEEVFSGLMRRYAERVPDVRKIVGRMEKAGMIRDSNDIENDHVAFRTMKVRHLGVRSLEKIFLHLGYEKKDHYSFPKKKLDAWWYSPPEDGFPRVFISELRVEDLAPEIAEIVRSYTDEVQADPVDALDLDNAGEIDGFLHGPLWRLPDIEDFNALQNSSEYASWVIYNRYYLNHFTIGVHDLPSPYDTVEKFNAFLKSFGIKLNDASGEIKTSNDGKLIQSSTVAAMIEAEFNDGNGNKTMKTIPGSYVEFAERLPLEKYETTDPAKLSRRHRRDGFDTGNADGIFESTFTEQTGKRAFSG